MSRHLLHALAGALALSVGLAAPAEAAQRVAVVVGVTDYARLPDTLDLPETREEISEIARLLRESGGFDQVQILLDSSATRANVRAMLVNSVVPSLQPGDTLVWIYAGQGFGGDFGNPYLLLYDSTVDDTTSTIDFYSFTRDLMRRAPGVQVVVITDAAHPGAQDGVALLGPTARNLADLPGNFFALSATGPREVASDGVFLGRLHAALEGKADADGDHQISAGELHRYMLEAVARDSGESAHPADAGAYDPDLIVSEAGGHRASSGRHTKAPSEGGASWGGPVSYSLMGAGALSGGVAVWSTLAARNLCAVHGDTALCTSVDDRSRYLRYRSLATGATVASAVLLASGLGLSFVPLEGGAVVQFGGRF